jgi:hypothetical protein
MKMSAVGQVSDFALNVWGLYLHRLLMWQEVALKHGLLLVDTKYEFGKASDGSILLIDEVNLYCFFLTYFYGDMPHADWLKISWFYW